MLERISIAVLKDMYRYSIPEESRVNKNEYLATSES